MKTQNLKYMGDFINGRFTLVEKSDGSFKDVSPSDLNDTILVVPFKRDHMDEACKAAREAYLPWARKTLEERRGYLLRLKEIFDKKIDEMAELIARDTGKQGVLRYLSLVVTDVTDLLEFSAR